MPPSTTTPAAPRALAAVDISSPQWPACLSPAAATSTTQPGYIRLKKVEGRDLGEVVILGVAARVSSRGDGEGRAGDPHRRARSA